MNDEFTHLKEAIRQKKALVETLERDLRGVRQSLDRSTEKLLKLLEKKCNGGS